MRRQPILRGLALALVIVLVSGCGSALEPTSTVLDLSGGAPPPPPIDTAVAETGVALYLQHCASCHGADLKGAPNWKTPNDDGSYPPPPHDDSGHTWHHSDTVLIDLILKGSEFEQSRMPAFAGTLTEADVKAILEYLKSEWGEQERTYQWHSTWRESQR
jgi:mono/diheme cytochrome c family protein